MSHKKRFFGLPVKKQDHTYQLLKDLRYKLPDFKDAVINPSILAMPHDSPSQSQEDYDVEAISKELGRSLHYSFINDGFAIDYQCDLVHNEESLLSLL